MSMVDPMRSIFYVSNHPKKKECHVCKGIGLCTQGENPQPALMGYSNQVCDTCFGNGYFVPREIYNQEVWSGEHV